MSLRRYIDLIENAQANAWPATMSAKELLKHAKQWHQITQDFVDGDIVHNIMSYETYDLRRVPLDHLDLDGFEIDDDKVADYAERTTEAPPIIVGQWGMILDGNHRANAAAKRGDKDILAYVGEPTHITEDAQDVPDFSLLGDEELGAYALAFLEKHAGVRPDYDPDFDDPEERWTGPDSALLHAAATLLSQGEKPIPVRSDWGSGTYRGWNNPALKAEHDALVAAINART